MATHGIFCNCKRCTGTLFRGNGGKSDRPNRGRRLGGYATREAQKTWEVEQRGPRHEQYRDDDVVVKVQSGYSHDLQVPTTDVLINTRDGTDAHQHTVLDPNGNVIFDEWRERPQP